MDYKDVQAAASPIIQSKTGRIWRDTPRDKQLAICAGMNSGLSAADAIDAAYAKPAPQPVAEPTPAPAAPPVIPAVTLSHGVDMTATNRRVFERSDLEAMTPSERYALIRTAQAVDQSQRKSAYRLEETILTRIIRDSLTAAYDGEPFTAASIIRRHVPDEYVKAVAQRSIGNKRRQKMLSQLSQHSAVTLIRTFNGRAGLNNMLGGTVSAAVNEIARQVPLMKRLSDVETEVAGLRELPQQVEALQTQVAMLNAVIAEIQGGPAKPQASAAPRVRAVMDDAVTAEVLRLKAEDKSVREIEAITGINRGKVHRIIKAEKDRQNAQQAA